MSLIFVFSKAPGEALFVSLASLVSLAVCVASYHLADSQSNDQILIYMVPLAQVILSE